jgi:autotransporter-associated beta strand protein
MFRKLSVRTFIALVAFLILSICGTLDAATIVKANNTTSLSVGTSWVGGVAPGITDVAQWNSTVTSRNETTLGTSVYLGEIAILNPGGPVTVDADGNSLGLFAIGGTGIDMSSATQGLTLNCPVLLESTQTWNVASGQTLTVNGVIGGIGPGLNVAGSGTVVLSGNNTYTGGTNVAGGTLRAGNGNAFGWANSQVTVNSGATLDLAGNNFGCNNSGAFTYPVSVGGVGVDGDGAIVDSSGGGNLGNLSLTSDTTLGGTSSWGISIPEGIASATVSIAGNGYSLTKVGNNNISINGAGGGSNSYDVFITGIKNINIDGGTLSVQNATLLDNSQPGFIFVNPGGTFNVGGTSYAGTSVSIQKPIVMAGGVLQTYSGAYGNAAIIANIFLNTTGKFSPPSGSTLELDGTISDGTASNGISLNGMGVLLLTATNSYSGDTNINQGTLRLGSNSAIPSGIGKGNVTIVAGAVLDVNGYNVAINGLSGGGAVSIQSGSSGTLNVGNNNVNSTFSGVLQDTSGTLNVVKSGSGTLTLNGYSNYGGGTAINAGVLKIGAAYSVSSNSGVTVTGGTLDITAFPQTVSSLTIGSLGALNLKVGNLLTSINAASFAGTLDISGATGTGEIMAYGSYGGGTFTTVTGLPSGDRLAYNANQLDIAAGLANNSILGASTTSVSLGRIMLNYVPTTNVTASLAGGTSATGFGISTSGGATASAIGNAPGAVTPSASGTITIGLPNVAGSYSGIIEVQNSGDDGSGNGPSSAGTGQGNAQSPILISVTGTVVNNRVVTSTSASFGLVHVGVLLSQGITLSTTGSDSQYTRVTVANGSNGFLTVSGGSSPTFNSASVTDNRTLSGTAGTAGVFNGTVTLTTGREGLTGETPINVPVNYSVQVFSGSGVWNGSSGSWGSVGSPNWADANSSGVQAAPGTFAGFNNTDTANFSGSGSVTAIDLTGANPSLNALSFSNSNYTLSNGSLTLNGGSGTATVTVSSGTQSISTPITLASNANFAINGGALLLNSTIAGSGGFTKSGTGGLTLPESNTLSSTGSIAIAQGSLMAPFGISHGGGGIILAAGANLQAAGQVNRAVAGTGAVTATGDLFIGNSQQTGQFNQGGASGVGGSLNIGGNALVILSADTAILGSQTNMGPGGSLMALNGAQLGNPTSVDVTKILTATGSAQIHASFVNNGVVNGPTGIGQELTFNEAVTGAGSTTGNVEYAASYRPSNSPDEVSVQNLLLDPTSTLIMELDGTTPGSGYDQLDISALAMLNGVLDVDLLNGFSPSAGESFQILDGPTTGSFAQINTPALNNGLSWNTGDLYTNGTISVVPEPSTLSLLAAAAAIGLAGYRLRRRRLARRTAKPAAFDQHDAPAILSFPSRSSVNAARRAA